MNEKSYSITLYRYGINNLLKILKEHEIDEKYEECAKIKAVIEEHNQLANDNLPTNAELTIQS